MPEPTSDRPWGEAHRNNLVGAQVDAGPVLIRDMRWTDIEDAHHIEQQSFAVDVWSLETFWSELAGVPERRRYLVAVVPALPVGVGQPVGQEIVGYAGLAFSGSECDVQTIVVAPAARGRGIGERLLVELLATGQRLGCERCHLEVSSDNHAAEALYRRHGFQPVSRRIGYYGGAADAVTMQATLSAPLPPAGDRFGEVPMDQGGP
ncbi:MAG: GNAT family N-acetyltransferase [Actinomycetes bacterium]